jgi:hypothetical protein
VAKALQRSRGDADAALEFLAAASLDRSGTSSGASSWDSAAGLLVRRCVDGVRRVWAEDENGGAGLPLMYAPTTILPSPAPAAAAAAAGGASFSSASGDTEAGGSTIASDTTIMGAARASQGTSGFKAGDDYVMPALDAAAGADLHMGYGSFHQKYYLDEKLVAVGVVDVLPHCLVRTYVFGTAVAAGCE